MTGTLRRTGGPFTVEDYNRLPEGAPYVLVGGHLVMTPSPTLGHQSIVARLIQILDPRARERGGRAVPDLDTWLEENSVVRPDLVVLLGEHASQLDIPRRRPTLAIEIVSPSNREYDHGAKWEAYRRAGLAEIWRLDPESESVTIQRPGREDAVHHDRVSPQFAPDLEIDLPALFGDVRGLF